ncbi:unnamed protein product [Spirodela intermedia]|uniref:Uncharacterized protein n=1 Tax=Spirodela intermedia TaxID=51605 RepID=A0A7I8LL52_SPIIN|nr:unnamed protein product [Spirodela intermedia]
MAFLGSCLVLLLPPFLFFILKSLYTLVWVPEKIRRHYRRQGIGGPPPRHLIFGNSGEIRDMIARAQSRPILDRLDHDITRRTFLFWFGSLPRLAVADPAIVRELVRDSGGGLDKVEFNPQSKQLFGEGLVGLKGKKWALHRRIINPTFNMERVKSWVPEIATCASKMLDNWERMGANGGDFEVEVGKELQQFAADVISRVAFGSSYKEGSRIFQLQEEQALLVYLATESVYIPGFSYIPTRRNRRRQKIDTEIRESLRRLIRSRGGAGETSNNLLGLLMSSNMRRAEEDQMGIEEIIDECKTFYFAGKDTTGNLLTWALLLLGLHQEWQTKTRKEVKNLCGEDNPPTAEDIPKLKTIGLVLNETLRLYSPAPAMRKLATKNVKLGALEVAAGTEVFIPIGAVNRDMELWGDDACRFDPLRFSDGRRRPAGAYLPFGFGPTICVGQNLAIVEAKVALAMILQRFSSFSVAPSYVHAPSKLITLQPQYGLQIIFHKA